MVFRGPARVATRMAHHVETPDLEIAYLASGPGQGAAPVRGAWLAGRPGVLAGHAGQVAPSTPRTGPRCCCLARCGPQQGVTPGAGQSDRWYRLRTAQHGGQGYPDPRLVLHMHGPVRALFVAGEHAGVRVDPRR